MADAGAGDVAGGERRRDVGGFLAVIDRIDAGAAVEMVVGAVADEDVVARSADGVFNGHALGDRDVADHAADAGEMRGAQVDESVLAVAREVEGVVAAGIPHAEDQRRGGRGGGKPAAPGGAVEAVDGVGGARAHIGAVEDLRGGDIVHHRRRGIEPAVVGAGVGGRPVAHQRVLLRILVIAGVDRIGRRAVAGIEVLGFAQADGVADFVGQGQLAVIALGRAGHVAQRLVDPDIVVRRPRAGVAGIEGGGRRPGIAGGVVAEQDGGVVGKGVGAGAAADAHEGDVGDVGPAGQGLFGGVDLGRREMREAVGIARHGARGIAVGVGDDRRRAGDAGCVERMAVAQDLLRRLVDRQGWLAVGSVAASAVNRRGEVGIGLGRNGRLCHELIRRWVETASAAGRESDMAVAPSSRAPDSRDTTALLI